MAFAFTIFDEYSITYALQRSLKQEITTHSFDIKT